MTEPQYASGRVIKLDRGYPLVRIDDGEILRCEHATSLIKSNTYRAVIGDNVEVLVAPTHEKGIIENIAPRNRALVRKDPAERSIPQVLASNFDLVLVVDPIGDLNPKRIERELVVAYDTGAEVAVVLTKVDLLDDQVQFEEYKRYAQELCGPQTRVLFVSKHDEDSIQKLRDYIGPNRTAALIGRSGVGKSSIVNNLAGAEIRATGEVRASDGKGRHVTVSRAMVPIGDNSYIYDMPGIRGLGLWEAEEGIKRAFSEIEELASKCRFKDCTHAKEPGCAVREAVEQGNLNKERLASYLDLVNETTQMRRRHEEACRKRGIKASDKKRKGSRRKR